MSELDRYLDDLVRRRRPHPFRAAEDDVPVIAAAIDLSAARPGEQLPSEQFVGRLHALLALEFGPGAEPTTPERSTAAATTAAATTAAATTAAGATAGSRTPPAASGRRQFLRRTGIAAACVACAAAGSMATRSLYPAATDPEASDPGTALQPNVGTWQTVTTADAVPEGTVHAFEISGLRGFVHRREDGQLLALSGVCTHQGCLLIPATGTPQLECPCHHTTFDLDGQVVHSHLARRPPQLPRIPVRVRDGQVQVLAPVT